MRKFDVNEINLAIEEVKIQKDTIIISWSSEIGFGEYVIRCSEDHQKFFAESECMDKDKDKSFGTKLLELWMEQIIIHS